MSSQSARTFLRWSIIIGIFSLHGCVSPQRAIKSSQQTTPTVPSIQQFTWFSGKAKAHYQSPEQSLQFQLLLRVRRDSAIWLSASKAGVEGFRILARPDSVFMLDRQQRQYYARSFSYASELLGFTVTFDDLQRVLIHGRIFTETDRLQWRRDNETLICQATRDQHLQGVLYLQSNDSLPTRILLVDTRQRQFHAEYTSYILTPPGYNFSSNRLITALDTDRRTVQLNLQFQQVEFDAPRTLSWNVPTGYQRL